MVRKLYFLRLVCDANYCLRLEVGRYVLSVPGAVYRAYDTEASANHALEDAIQDGTVRVILIPVGFLCDIHSIAC